MKKHPYQGLAGDEREHVLEDTGPEMDFEECMTDRATGINAEPTEGVRDGVKSTKRMHPDHYIRNPRGCH